MMPFCNLVMERLSS